MISKYQFMELNLQRRVTGLKGKMPDIQKTLDVVRFLKLKKVGIEPDLENIISWLRSTR